MKSILLARKLTFAVGHKRVVNNLDFEAKCGEIIAICGPNGAGKSTALRLLSGELRPSSGDILIDGVPITKFSHVALAQKRAVMMQQAHIAFAFTGFEVVRLGAASIGAGLSTKDRDGLAHEALTDADAQGFAGDNVQHLSGGEQQRIAYARALAQIYAGRSVESEQILFLDEPTASLDIRHQLALLRHARSLARSGRVAVIIVLHDLMLARSFADTVVVMKDGCVAANATASSPLPRSSIEDHFAVSLGDELCPPTPWVLMGSRPLDGL